jgi:hypothetical protein
MSNRIIPQKPIENQPPLTHVRKMSSQEFWGRLANSSKVRIDADYDPEADLDQRIRHCTGEG